jgi:hypothetical protein
MNQKLRLLLQNHFNWSFEFSNDMNLLLEHKKLLEQYLTDIESDLHLQPRQLLRLLEEQKIDSLILYIKSCYQLGHLLHPNMDNLLITQFNQTMSKLLESGFTAEQLSLFKPSIYLKRDEQQAICQKIKFISKTYNDCTSELIAAHSQTFFCSPQTSPETISSISSSNSQFEEKNAEIDEETWAIIRNL